MRSPPSSPPRKFPWWRPCLREGETLHFHGGYRYAVFPRRGGRWPELGTADEREWVGRFLGRIHAVGRAAVFRERPVLSIEDLGRGARDFVLEGDWMPDYLADKYADLTETLLEEVEDRARGWRGAATGRILGDCHRGNILWTDAGSAFRRSRRLRERAGDPGPLDADRGEPRGDAVELADLLRGYEQFLPFNRREVALDRAAAGACA